MNVPEHTAAGGLSPEAAELVNTYFTRVHGALLVAAAGECEDAVEALREHVLEELAGTAATPADVTRILAELGPPEALAAACAESAVEDGQVRPPDVDSVRLHGTLLGMPYDVRMPNSDRIASRWWNPLEPRVFVPRVFGIGWDINFGAVAVKVHLVRPDDEDVPFATVPKAVVTGTLLLPALLAAATLALMAIAWPTLPASVPSHWDVFGRADQFWDRGALVIFLAAMSLVPVAFAAVVHMRGRAALNRVAASAFATLTATFALSQFIQTTMYVRGDQGITPTFVGLGLGLALPFLMLVILSRVGRAAEQRRDLEKTTKKGSV
jgi:hypothetical protein